MSHPRKTQLNILYVLLILSFLMSACNSYQLQSPVRVIPSCKGFVGTLYVDVAPGKTEEFKQPGGKTMKVACNDDGDKVTVNWTEGGVTIFDVQPGTEFNVSQSATYAQPTAAPYAQPTAAPYLQPTAAPAATAAPYLQPTAAPYVRPEWGKFTPNWAGLTAACPSFDELLNAHNLRREMLVGNDEVPQDDVVWEPCRYAIEFKPEFYGTEVNLQNGYQYTADTTDERIVFWGGDPYVTRINLYHGTTFRWMPTYAESAAGRRLLDPAFLVVSEYHFGRCYRNADSGREDVPYYNRVGPYITYPGNVYPEWTPLPLDQIVVDNPMDAVALLGGLLEGWKFENGNARWIHPKKGQTGAENELHYWQQFCMPHNSSGYIEIWNVAGQVGPNGSTVSTAGSQKYFADDNRWLLNWSVDEMSYHPYANR